MLFTVGLTCVGRLLLARDLLRNRQERKTPVPEPRTIPSRHTIVSGRYRLDAAFVRPASLPNRAALLICHGIGETAEDWWVVQEMLAAEGVSSLVFDYAGYGRSSGWVTAAQCERDACAAFTYLQELTPAVPISVLGFSLGSGVACAVLGKVPVRALVLCAAYTSFHGAAGQLKIPSFLVTPLWDNEAALRNCKVPVVILHGERDWLFPLPMAYALHHAGGPNARLLTFPVTHDEPFTKPSKPYWRNVAEAALPGEA